MKKPARIALVVVAVIVVAALPRAGAARPGGGRPAGGMARPAGGMARPATPAARPQMPAARPNIPATRPQMPAARPQMPATRPQLSTARPQVPNARPQMPNVSRPQGMQRPSLGGVQGPGMTRPAMPGPATRPALPTAGARPSLPSATPRPGLGSLRPTGTTRPAPAPGLSLPGGGGRPTTLPGQIGGRPGGIAGPTTRPSFPRPSPGGLPGGNRPGIGGNRPGIGDGNNFWNSGNINSGNWNNTINNVNVNRPWGGGGWAGAGWGHGGGWGYPGYGGGWAGAWNGGCVNPHYGWYNGCWGGGWWAPFAVGAATWGLASTVANWGLGYGAWGYNTAYANPYYSSIPATVVAASPYDYAQPVAVTTYATNAVSPTQDVAAAVAQPDAVTEAERVFDEALARFKAGDYTASLAGLDKVVRLSPQDPIVHEVRALALFALSRYPEAAATLNAVLAAAPGMDWTTMSGLYGSVDAYAGQLRKLEEFCRAHPDDAAAHFVLAYHYLVGGHDDLAADALRIVVAKQPADAVAKQLLAAVEPKPAAESTAPAAEAAAAGPETDLVGTWIAKAGDDAVTLTIRDDSTFSWKATPKGQPPVEITGTIETARDAIALVSEKAGTMGGSVVSKGPDAFEFTLSGGPPGAQPLVFQRQK